MLRDRPTGPVAPSILFAVFQTGAQANGGVESVTRIIEGLTMCKRIVLTNRETGVCERWRASGASVVVIPLPYRVGEDALSGGAVGVLRRLISLVATNYWVWRQARAGAFSALHCNDPAPFWHVVPAAAVAHIPVLWNLRDTKASAGDLNKSRYRRRFRWCNHILVLSREMAKFYAQVYPDGLKEEETPISHIYSVVDFDRLKPIDGDARSKLRESLGIGDKDFAIGYVAAFNDKKNQYAYICEAAPKLKEVCPRAKTFFVGDFDPTINAYSRRCLEAADNLGLPIRFAGYTRGVEKWYQACDVIVVPTRKEGLARCMIEALSCGTPVVSFDVCSAREILEENRCGCVVEQGDYSGLAACLADLELDANKRLRLRENAIRASRELFDERKSVPEHLELYRRLVSLNAGS